MRSRRLPEPAHDAGLLLMFGFRKKFSTLVRPLVTDDAEACARIHAEAFHRGWSNAEFERLILDPLVIGDGSFEAGKSSHSRNRMLYGFVVSRLIAGDGEVLTIAVDQTARGNHVASALLMDHLALLQRAGCRKLFLEVAEDNTAALGLYRKFSFRKVGNRPEYYARPGKNPINAHILSLDM